MDTGRSTMEQSSGRLDQVRAAAAGATKDDDLHDPIPAVEDDKEGEKDPYHQAELQLFSELENEIASAEERECLAVIEASIASQEEQSEGDP